MKFTATVLLLALVCGVATITTTEAKCTKICVAYCSGAAKVKFGKVMKCYESLPVCKRTGNKRHPWSVSGRKNDYRACRPPKGRNLRHNWDETFDDNEETNIGHSDRMFAPFAAAAASVVQYNPFGSNYHSHGPTNWQQAQHFQSWNNHDDTSFWDERRKLSEVAPWKWCEIYTTLTSGRELLKRRTKVSQKYCQQMCDLVKDTQRRCLWDSKGDKIIIQARPSLCQREGDCPNSWKRGGYMSCDYRHGTCHEELTTWQKEESQWYNAKQRLMQEQGTWTPTGPATRCRRDGDCPNSWIRGGWMSCDYRHGTCRAERGWCVRRCFTGFCSGPGVCGVLNQFRESSRKEKRYL
jgi:hypothetical protein